MTSSNENISALLDERDYPSMLKRNLIYVTCSKRSLQWRHNGQDSVSNHQPHECLLNRIFSRRSKKTSKLRVTGLCVGNSSVTGEFPHKWPVTRKMFSFWWLHHVIPGEKDGRHWVAVCGAPTQFWIISKTDGIYFQKSLEAHWTIEGRYQWSVSTMELDVLKSAWNTYLRKEHTRNACVPTSQTLIFFIAT